MSRRILLACWVLEAVATAGCGSGRGPAADAVADAGVDTAAAEATDPGATDPPPDPAEVADVASDLPDTPDALLPDALPPDACAAANARLGLLACRTSVPDVATFLALSVPYADWPDVRRALKFTLPAVPAAQLPPVFQYMGRFLLHYDFLVAAFPDLFGTLTPAQYLALSMHRETRQYWVGIVIQVAATDGLAYAFEVYSDPADLEQDEVSAIFAVLSPVFAPLPLMYAPETPAEAAKARSWASPGFPIYYGSWLGGG